ncbi:hypothetical protein CIRG_01088 [Coccidioides immitis RMSCC 2394]|uniref:Ribosome quality control complex subunit 2 n=1 Tax=Coccidioides immitis RMSCC 2394 TaxID=404692 RepID=A0A0J6Y2U3_COCIT|nr:hypothetical protein CIRG_01088 [Coccidioides immitis RMSCC 2394]
MKQRFSSLDVKVICRELSAAVVGLRVSNIYDLSSRTYLFKIAKPDVRKQLIVDSGFRCHITEYSRVTAPAPSHFVSRLRGFLKSRRITAVSQVGTDRIVHIEFSDGYYHLFLEFFASGNIILTDNEYKIVALLRIVPEGEDQDEVRLGLKYRLDNKQNYEGVPPPSVDRLKTALQKGKERDASISEPANKRAKKKQEEALRRALSLGFPEYPPVLLEHALHVIGFDSSLRPDQILETGDRVNDLMRVLREVESISNELSTTEQTRGYIVARNENKPPENPSFSGETKPDKSNYIDYHPFAPRQFVDGNDTSILTFDSFNKAVDEYYSSVETQKLESRLTEREETMKRKLEATKRDHEKRVGALQQVQEIHTRRAEAIATNLRKVEEVMNAVNGLIAQGMDWVEIARLIEMEQSRQNPVAKLIKLPLKLYENTVTVLLPEGQPDGEDDDSEESGEEDEENDGEAKKKPQRPEVLSVDIDLGLTPWANASQYYDQKKTAAIKEDKTIKASKQALKSAEKKLTTDLKRGLKQEKPVLRPARIPFWFEKFYFFISSDGYLVLGIDSVMLITRSSGSDDRQNEILYHRHLRKGDVYVHADMEGAIPLIVKNKPGASDAPIPPGTLAQAGTFTVATSRAWESKALMGAWWVNADQVSKTTPSGEYLATGGVVIRGGKNHLAPGQLILGFAVMFQISPESVRNHTRHRLEEPVSSEMTVKNDHRNGTHEPSEMEKLEESPNTAVDNCSIGKVGMEQKPRENTTDLPVEQSAQTGIAPQVKEPQGEAGLSREDKDALADPDLQQQLAAFGATTKHVSAQERRLMKRGAGLHASALSELGLDEEDEDEEENQSTPSTFKPSGTQTLSIQSTSTSKSQLPVRGKRGKAKKLASKYKDQDEEDRELALRLLGSAPKTTTPKKTKEDREAEIQAQKERRRAQHDKAAQAERRRQENFQKRPEGQNQALDMADAEQVVEDLSSLPALVGTPALGDEIISAIPVCAPWSALGQYKYRAKLQPGPTGKGKIVKEILGKWIVDASAIVKAKKLPTSTSGGGNSGGQEKESPDEPKPKENDQPNLTTVELELLKGWREAEIINSLPIGKVRIVSVAGAGGSVSNIDDGKGKGKKAGGGSGKGGKGGGKGGKKR